MGKCCEDAKGAPEVKKPVEKQTKGSCGCGCVPTGKEK